MHPYRGWPFLSAPHHPILSAAWAVFVHGSLALLVVSPILLRAERRALLATLAFLGGVALDLDHAAAAGSLSARAMEHLGHRPDTHSLSFALALALLALLATRRKLVAWSVFAVVLAHLLFDAVGAGVYWLFPLRQPDSIPWLACPFGIAVLFAISAMLARRAQRSAEPRRRFVLFSARPLGLLACAALAGALPTRAAARAVPDHTARADAARRLIFSEDFNGPAGSRPSARRWNYDVGGGGWGNDELQYYTSRRANARLDGRGHLLITARTERYTGADGVTRSYTSARLQTLHTFEFEYGLVQARIKIPAAQGLRPAFWMLGNDAYQPHGWPGSGEIDDMEVLGSRPDVVKGTVHGPWAWAPHGIPSSMRSAASLAAGFHVYAVQWEPDRISFLLDGAVYGTVTPADLPQGAAWPFQHPYFLLLSLGVGGIATGVPSVATFPAKMIVDWVRVWQSSAAARI